MAARKEQSKVQGRVSQAIGVILIIIGMGIFIFSDDYGMIGAFIGGAIAITIFSAGMSLYKSGKSTSQFPQNSSCERIHEGKWYTYVPFWTTK